MSYELLEKINSPDDLKALPEGQMPELCEQIRGFLIENVTKTGGHLASNLGVTEMSVAIHRVFNSPSDKIIFDVGHQAYVHKLLTGRYKDFETLRRPGGLSGFTLSRESEHDPFGAGHSSTSLSAALGFAEANVINGSKDYVVAVVGDGAFTGGMIHEALNNCRRDLRLIIILNENRMSISKNKGTFASYLAKMRVSEGYIRWKSKTVTFLGKIPLIGAPLKRLAAWIKNTVKKLIYKPNYFEALDLYYYGPVNGNSYEDMERALATAKASGKCTVIHAYTKKGKGYEPAERSPDDFHSVHSSADEKKSFHAVFADELINLGKEDERVVAVTAAMGIGTGLDAFGKAFPDRYFDVGIAEPHAMTFSAGLSAAGFKPYVAIYSTFLQRAYDNILHDVALQGLPVRIMIDRASLAVSDGPTHHGIFDVAFLSHVPGMTVISPVTYGTLCEAIRSSASLDGPVAIRYPNSSQSVAVRDKFYPDADYGKFGVVSDFDRSETPENVFVCYGQITERVIEAQKILSSRGIESGIVLAERLKPHEPCAESVAKLISGAKRVLFVEEGILRGGFSEAMVCLLAGALEGKSYGIRAINDNFAAPTSPCDLYEHLGLSAERLAEAMLKLKSN